MESNKHQQQLAVLQAKNDRLQAQLNKLERADRILNAILEGTATTTGDDFFNALVTQLAIALKAKYVLLGEPFGNNQEQIKTLAYWSDGQLANNFNYDLLGSPCATVINNKIQYYPQKTYELFPEDTPLVQKQIECYLGVPLFNSVGENIGIIVVMHDDILEKVQDAIPIISTFAARAAAELERQQNETTLRDSEQRYRLLVEQSNEIFFLMYDGRFELVNHSFCKLFEVTPEIVYDRDFKVIDLVHPSDRETIREKFAETFAGNQPPDRLELLAQTINGRSLPISVSLSFLNYKEETAVQGILHDLTQQKKEETRIQEQQALTKTLYQIGTAFSSSLETNVILDMLLELVGRVVPYDSANVILIEDGQTSLVRARGYKQFGIEINPEQHPPSYPIKETSTWQKIIKSKKPLVIPDITQYDDWLQPTHTKHVRSWASAPIIVNGEIVAFLSTNKIEANFYTDEHGNRLAAFAAQASLAWQNAQLLTAATERADALNATGNILRALNAATEVHDALPTIVPILQELTGTASVTIAKLDIESKTLAFIGLQDGSPIQNPTHQLHLKDTAATEDIKNGRVHFAPDIKAEFGYRAANLLYQHGIRSYISLPLIGNKQPLGALTLSWTNYQGYNEEQIPFLKQIADAVALGIERSNLYNATQYRSQELNLLYKVISAAASGGSQEDILQTSCLEIASFLNIPHVTLALLKKPLTIDQTDLIQATVGAQFILEGEPDLLDEQLLFAPEGPLFTMLATTRAPFIIDKLDALPLSSYMRQLINLYNLNCALFIPITLRQNIIGIIGIGSKEKRIFQDSELHLLQTVAEELGRVLEITSLYNQLRHHAADLEMRVVARTRELADANEQLKELDKMKSRFVSDVSHELRTPVTNLKLYLDLLGHKGSDSLAQYLPILQRQADRLGQLIQDILDLSRLELSKVKLEFNLVDLNDLITDIIMAHEPRAEAKNLCLKFEPDTSLPEIWGERNQLAQVVTNLVSNAINYSSDGDVLLKTAVFSPMIVSLTVTDRGMGITAEDLPHLFDRFYRGQHVHQSNIPGTGLGLAIADEIVRIHNGRIEVDSIEGQGSTFRVLLPIE